MHPTTIGFIGAGNMAGSLIRGLLAGGAQGASLLAADVDSDKLHKLAGDCGISALSNQQVAERADVIVLAVKPQVMPAVCSELDAARRRSTSLIVSIAAGITVASLEHWLGKQSAIVRCMPNTPALIGKGATGLFANARVSPQQRRLADTILASVGLTVWVERETDIDAITALSGSGPAYFFLFMEAMQQAALDMGLKQELARRLISQTALGAAQLAADSSDDVAVLRRQVTSPGGTTEAALQRFQAGGLEELVADALQAARARSVELAQRPSAE